MLDPAFVRMAREAPILCADEERDLIRRSRAGDDAAKERIVRSHLRLVIKEAAKRGGYKVAADDLVQEGQVGIVEAISRFDESKPVRFATYAMWWIRAAMNDAAMRGHSVVRRNTTQRDKALFFKLRRARADLERGNRFSDGEITDRLALQFDCSPTEIVSMTAYLGMGDKALNAPIPCVDGDESIEAIDLLVDDGPLPDAAAAASLLSDVLFDAVAMLNDRERFVINSRQYAESGSEMTLDELGDRFGVTRERVRQIEVAALRKLRGMLVEAGIGPDGVTA